MRIITFIIIVFLFFSCSPVQIKHISQVNKFNKPSFVFSLPKTALSVNIEVEKQILKKGPYAEYAEKYLGIENVNTKNIEKFKIKNIEINEHIIADSEQIFVVQYKNKFPWQSIVQQKDGVILAINKTNIKNTTNQDKALYSNPNLDQIFYKELTQSSYIKEKIDTIFKQVKVDTNWVRIAVQKKSIDTLKVEDKAKEAAQHILDIRSRLFDLLTGDMETLPQGEAAKTIVEYLKSEEQEYLSLFLGKTFITTVKYNFEVIPESSNQNEIILAYFDPNKGIVNNSSKHTLTLKLSLKYFDYYKPYTMAQLKYQKAQKKNIFPFRIPIQSQVSIGLNEDVLFQKSCWIYQFGKTMEIPVCFLKNYQFNFSNPTTITISK